MCGKTGINCPHMLCDDNRATGPVVNSSWVSLKLVFTRKTTVLIIGAKCIISLGVPDIDDPTQSQLGHVLKFGSQFALPIMCYALFSLHIVTSFPRACQSS